MSLGPLMIDLEGTALSSQETELLANPLVGGVILFSRNFESVDQLKDLVEAVHALRTPRLLIVVDHEGGRVQRFHREFTPIPPAAEIGKLFNTDRSAALKLAKQTGWLLAAELRAVGVDMSFAPVVDIETGKSSVIGDRAWHRKPASVVELTRSFIQGMKQAGMAATIKHFPGHGSVSADSHHELPVDDRRFIDIQQRDMLPFERLIQDGVPAVMTAHIRIPDVDDLPVSFSKRWIREELRHVLDFRGAVFSDDLCMEGAASVGNFIERAKLALRAGCDMLPVCNSRAAVVEILEGLQGYTDPAAQVRLVRLHGRDGVDWETLRASDQWRECRSAIQSMQGGTSLELDF
ncbi:MAG: beta-N-acetylhexosaminidase [Gammaproteobacteria bacterium]